MAKKMVHQLATELGIPRKDLLDYLKGKGYATMTAVTLVPENEIEGIKANFGKNEEAEDKTPEPQADTADQNAEDKDDKAKKSGMFQVVRSQNATSELPKRTRKKTVKKEADEEKKDETASVTSAEEAGDVSGAEKTGKEEAAPVKKTRTSKKKTEESSGTQGEEGAKEEKPVKEKKARSSKKAEKADAAEEEAKTGKTSSEGDDAGKTASSDAKADDTSSEKKTKKASSAKDEKSEEASSASDEKKTAEDDKAPEKEEAKAPETKQTIPLGKPELNLKIIKKADPSFAEKQKSRGAVIVNNKDRYGSRSFGGDRGERRQGGAQGGRGTSPFRQQDGGRSFGGQRPFDGKGKGASPFSDRQGGRGGAAQGGRGPAGGFGKPKMGGGAASDGALAHKTTRDFRKDSKDKERAREEHREQGRHDEMGRGRKQFNRVPKALQQKSTPNQEVKKEVVTQIRVPEKITIRELADLMKIQASQLVKELFMKGEMVTVNHELPFEKAEEIAMEHDILCEKEEKEDVIGALLAEEEESEDLMVGRPPVVCVMGHVDHGKTSLLDAIRDTHVTDREAGGITQHIGAYMVSIKGKKITFLDTPGHEAFTAMRMRGASSTDIAVLVVAADDGVMPQTIEAINHAKAAGVEIIVAVNKIDKPSANVDRVMQELSEYGLIAEDWGGSTIFCPVSAKTRDGIENLLEMILLTADMHELKANPNRKARGLVLEARLDKGRGPVASILIQKGTLKQGDFIACGAASGKVRAMTDENGRRLKAATPSMPVEIIGLSSVPEAGEVLVSLDSDKEAKDFASVFVTESKKSLIEETRTQMSLNDLFEQIKEGKLKELPIVVKADVQGSVEAITQSLVKLSNEEVVVKVIHGGVGAITESDVSLAAASNAIIIGFNVRPDATAKTVADNQKVDIHLYSVIYEAIEDVERALKGMRAAVYEEKVLGHAEIRQIFKASQIGNIAGSYVKDGTFTRGCKVRIFRGTEKIFEGELAALKRFKDDVKEVREGFECGLVFKDFGAFEVEDTVEADTMVEVERE